MVVDLMKLCYDDGLRAMALTAMDEDEISIAKAEELGVTWAIGSCGWYGEGSPYLNLNETTGTTYVYMVGRTGGIEWRGDPSAEPDEFLAALGAALQARGIPPLKSGIRAEVQDAARFYIDRDFPKARSTALQLHARFAKKRSDDAQAIAADAQYLVELVDEYQAGLVATLAEAATEKDPEAFLDAHDALVQWFPKSDAAKDAIARRKALAPDPEFVALVEGWEAWRDVRRQRPPSFPLRREKPEKRFAKTLEKYVKKHADGPGVEEAKSLLTAWRGGG